MVAVFQRIATFAAAALLCLPLAGCWKDQQQAAAICSATYPRPNDTITHYDLRVRLVDCMKAQGYRFVPASIACAGAPTPGRTPYCYEPDGLFARWGFYVERTLHPPPRPA
jgi:hypothetical protein